MLIQRPRNTGMNPGMFQRNPNASVPVSTPFFQNMDFDYDDGLHTPCQNVPMNMPGTHTQTRVPQNQNEWASFGWKQIARGFLGESYGGEWNRRNDMYFDPSRPMEMSAGLEAKDIEYAKLCERKNREILANMKPQQKRLLKALQEGRLFKLSALKLER